MQTTFESLAVHDSSTVWLPSLQAPEHGNDPGMRSALQQIRLDRRGATAVEYAMIALFISIAAFSTIVTIGSDVTSVFSKIASSF
jgi:pilus assembly protein Flp/PilA